MNKPFFIGILALFSLAACGVMKFGTDNQFVQSSFDSQRLQLEQRAMAGEITWVQAVMQTRDLDKHFANRQDLDTTWKFDSDEEEYHAYCIALAERLDKKEVSFAQFDAARLERLNSIRARRQSLNAQQQLINNSRQVSSPSGRSGMLCTKKAEWVSGMNRNCVYNCGGSDAVQTVGAAELCPITINH
jgi:hypothetical protein